MDNKHNQYLNTIVREKKYDDSDKFILDEIDSRKELEHLLENKLYTLVNKFLNENKPLEVLIDIYEILNEYCEVEDINIENLIDAKNEKFGKFKYKLIEIINELDADQLF